MFPNGFMLFLLNSEEERHLTQITISFFTHRYFLKKRAFFSRWENASGAFFAKWPQTDIVQFYLYKIMTCILLMKL